MIVITNVPEDIYKDIISLSSINDGRRNCKGIIMNAVNSIAFGTPLYDTSTNGDIYKAMFPEALIIMPEEDLPSSYLKVKVIHGPGCVNYYNLDWWNAPHKKEDL